MEPAERQLTVEVVYALPAEQVLLSVTLPFGSTVRDALERAGIHRHCPEIELSTCRVGIYGKACSRDNVLTDGDRVEIYRSLSAEPKQARHARVRHARMREEGG